MHRPTALIITTAGSNCERELARAFERAQSHVQLVHLNRLIRSPGLIDRFDLIGLPGGFSYGDAIAAGRIAAALMRRHLYTPLITAVQRGVPIIAPCNGFQIAVQMGLLPGPAVGEPWPTEPAPATAALAWNASGRFVDRWTRVEVPPETRCIWTQGLDMSVDAAVLPVAHAEGRFTVADRGVRDRLVESGQIAVRYAAGDNPNGSEDDIAGICDATGLIFGLMPHPERYTRWTHHPRWTSLPRGSATGVTPGLAMFRNAVALAARTGATARTF